MRDIPKISDAAILDFDEGTIEYHVEGDSTYLAENAFAFSPTTPHMGTLELKNRLGRVVMQINQEHDFEGFDDYLARLVAMFVEMFW